MKDNKFVENVMNVVNMNALCRELRFHDEKMIEAQRKIMISEIDETLEAIKNKDRKELVDGLADIFVTASFLEYLLCDSVADVERELNHQLEIKIKVNHKTFGKLCSDLKSVNKKGEIFSTLKSLIDFMDKETKKEITTQFRSRLSGGHSSLMEVVLDAVHESNMSKFPKLSDKTHDDIQKDLDFIRNNIIQKKIKNNEEPQANVGYEMKKGYIIYWDRDINKFQKPTTFKEPDIMWTNDIESLDNFFE